MWQPEELDSVDVKRRFGIAHSPQDVFNSRLCRSTTKVISSVQHTSVDDRTIMPELGTRDHVGTPSLTNV